MDKLAENALSLGAALAEHKGRDVAVLDLRSLVSWTDFFIIATASSSAHLAGLLRLVKGWAAETGLSPLSGGGKNSKDDSWVFIDLGSMVVHLMRESAREFYELENLWSGAKKLSL
jgi:ribosome-associated protein